MCWMGYSHESCDGGIESKWGTYVCECECHPKEGDDFDVLGLDKETTATGVQPGITEARITDPDSSIHFHWNSVFGVSDAIQIR